MKRRENRRVGVRACFVTLGNIGGRVEIKNRPRGNFVPRAVFAVLHGESVRCSVRESDRVCIIIAARRCMLDGNNAVAVRDFKCACVAVVIRHGVSVNESACPRLLDLVDRSARLTFEHERFHNDVLHILTSLSSVYASFSKYCISVSPPASFQ